MNKQAPTQSEVSLDAVAAGSGPGPAAVGAASPIDWERFYRNYRKPGYITGYEIVNKLGGGVFGIVFKARKESIGKFYAIKFLKVDDDSVKQAVVRELESVRLLAQVDHPNLVTIEDKGEIDGIPYIVMGYAGEETLKKRLEQGALPVEDSLRIFVQAARGVLALHERSLIHFDLKPANIFLRGDIARVGDYGLSKLVSESRNTLSMGRGTPYYMAPEMLKRHGDHRSDIYSLGIILYEMVAGRVPFQGDSEWEVLKKHETEGVVFPSGFPRRLQAVVARALEKDPAHRYQSAGEMLRDLQAPASLGDSIILPAEPRPAGPAGTGGTGGSAGMGDMGGRAADAGRATDGGWGDAARPTGGAPRTGVREFAERAGRAVEHTLENVGNRADRAGRFVERTIEKAGTTATRAIDRVVSLTEGGLRRFKRQRVGIGIGKRKAGAGPGRAARAVLLDLPVAFLSAILFVALLPLRMVGRVLGMLIHAILVVPFRILAFCLQISVYLVGAAVVLMLVVLVINLLSSL